MKFATIRVILIIKKIGDGEKGDYILMPSSDLSAGFSWNMQIYPLLFLFLVIKKFSSATFLLLLVEKKSKSGKVTVFCDNPIF